MNEPRDTKTITRLSAFAETALLLSGGSLAARALATRALGAARWPCAHLTHERRRQIHDPATV